jgi:hypothetical protein
MLPGMIPVMMSGGGGGGLVTATVTDSAAVDGTAIGTQSIGPESANRRVVLTVFQNSIYGGVGDVDITCGGITMSKQTVFSGSVGGGETGRMTVYWLDISAGTSAAFVASSSIGAYIVVWRVLGAVGGVSDFSSNAGALVSDTINLPAIDIPTNGVLLLHGVMGQQGSNIDFDGTGVSTLLDEAFTIGANSDRGGAGKREVTTAVSGATASATNAGATVGAIFGVTFGS